MNKIQSFIALNVRANPTKIVQLTAQNFGITRQAVHRHLRALIEKNLIKATGHTRARHYEIIPFYKGHYTVDLTIHQDEDKIWRDLVFPHVKNYPANILEICCYGFTEIMNNAIDHSSGDKGTILIALSVDEIQFVIGDNGVGIFRKIKDACGLEDEHQAILELSKGKLTTDPGRHSGEGIFFTSRAFDSFLITSYGLDFIKDEENEILYDTPINDWTRNAPGTAVGLRISPTAKTNLNDVFSRHTNQVDGDAAGFTKTIIALRLALYENEGLVSRSQAKRVMARADHFKEVVLDFEGIGAIRQGFADEIFRVFKNNHPSIILEVVNANQSVTGMIAHVRNNEATTPSTIG